MTIITKTFTYNLADDYLAQTGDMGKTADWTYIGPDVIYAVIDRDTNIYAGHFYLEEQDGATVPLAPNEYRVRIDCEANPLLCCLLHAEIEKPDYVDLDQHEELLPDGLTYKRPLNPPPDHTHDIRDIVFSETTQQATLPFPWKAPHSTWEQLRRWRNGILDGTDSKEGDYVADMPESLRTAWAEFRQKLRDIPQVHGGGNVHKFIDLTAQEPFNMVGSSLLKVTDATDIHVGDDVGVKGFPFIEIFGEHTKVIAVNESTKVVEIDKPLILTPSEANTEIAFSPCPATDPWKVGAHTAPNGEHGPLDKNGNPEIPVAVGSIPGKAY